MSTEELSLTAADATRRRARRSYWPARLRVLRVLAKLAFAGLFLAAFAVGVFRVTRMIGLPDVGDPFGTPAPVAPAGAEVDPMAWYAEASRELTDLAVANGRWNPRSSPLVMTWASAPPDVRAWAEGNGEALDLFRRASELRGVRGVGSATSPSPRFLVGRMADLVWLALLEGDRLRDEGDVKGAWGWYVAALRTTYHVGQRGDGNDRVFAQALRSPVADRIGAWVEDGRVGPDSLRTALGQLIACRALVTSDMETLETGYRQVMMGLDRGQWTQDLDAGGPAARGAPRVPEPLRYVWWQAGRFLDNEPERSRRVARLAFANWRAWLARPDGERPKPAIKTLVRFKHWTQRLDFYAPGPGAPPAARRMSPERLASWAETCRDARFPLSHFWSTFLSTRTAERNTYRGLVLQLAEQLYLRERGTPAPTTEALVGPYLKSLPDDGSSELDDGTTPVSNPEE